MKKLVGLKDTLKKWNVKVGDLSQIKNKVTHRITEIETLEEQQGGISKEHRAERNKLKMELEEICLREEIKLAQKSKTKWLKEGDSNNKFFCKVASNRARNIISKIQDSAGSIVESPNEIEKVLVGFFHILFSKNQHCRPFLDGLDLLKIKEEMRSEL